MLDDNLIKLLIYGVVPFCLLLRLVAVWIWWKGGRVKWEWNN
jgi:hypothetical protein